MDRAAYAMPIAASFRIGSSFLNAPLAAIITSHELKPQCVPSRCWLRTPGCGYRSSGQLLVAPGVLAAGGVMGFMPEVHPVLVTGAAGAVGSRVVSQLSAEGVPVRALVHSDDD